MEIRPLGSATQDDIDRIGSHWVGRSPAAFVATYSTNPNQMPLYDLTPAGRARLGRTADYP
jgi:hypothetical protein